MVQGFLPPCVPPAEGREYGAKFLPPCIPPQARGGGNELPSFPSSRFPSSAIISEFVTCRPSGALGYFVIARL